MKAVLIRLLTPPLAPALDLLTAAEAGLRSMAGTMELRFLDSSSAMEDLSRSSRSLVDNSAELVRLATGRREAERVISDTMSMLAEPLAFLNRYTERLVAHTTSLEEGCVLLGRLLGFETDLQSAVAPLRVMRTMFRVEAARLPEVEQAAFLTLSDQIETLHNQVRDTFGVEFARLAETRTAMNTLVAQLGNESSLQRAVLEREQAQIGAELDKLTRQIDLNSTRDVQLTALGRVVEAATSRVVMTLQNQDIVAQRTQHLFEGIGQIRTLGQEVDRGESTLLRENLAHLRALVEIQSGQVSSALKCLNETADESGSATSEILATVDALDHECVFLTQFSEVTAAANGTIQVLLDIVDKTREMVYSSVHLGMDSLEQIQPVNSLTTELSDSVERLSHQMNLVALNAQIQALHIDEGTGLEILAAHTAGVATETSRLGEAISADFDRLRSFLKVEVSSLTELCDTGKLHREYMETTGRNRENQLHAVRDAILGRLNQIGDDVATVRGNAARMAAASSMRPEEAEAFAKMQDALSNVTEEFREALSVFEPHDVLLSLADDGYTMASEREHHLKVVGGTGSFEEKSATATEQQSGVELF